MMRRLLVLALATVLFSTPVLPAAQPDPPGQVLVGEKLDPADYGPGIIEGMDEVLAREQARLAEEARKLKGRDGERGVWAVPSRDAADYPFSGERYVVNKWGDPCMAIGFPTRVDVHGAYFAGQGGQGVWTREIRVIGFRDDLEVQTTEAFRDICAGAVWFEMDLRGVNRIVIQATPAFNGRGWYALDDLTYTPVAGPGAPEPQTVVVDFEDTQYKQTLSGTPYAGLTWESGPGDFDTAESVHPPGVPPGFEKQTGETESAPEGLRGTGTLPLLLQDFKGIIRGDGASSSYPPDTCGAIGPNHFLSVVNRAIAAFDKTTGQRVWISNLGSFLPGSNGDPRVLYDQYSDRWIVIVSDFSTRTYLAVSRTNDPTGNWFKTNFVVSQGSDAGRWPDYPTLGVDANGIYSAAYMVGGGMSIFAVDKAPLIAPTPSLGTVTAFRELPWEGAIQPVQSFGASGGEYFVSRGGSTSLRVRKLTGPLTAPTLTELGFVTIPSHSYPPDAPALGSSVDLDTVDYRLMNAVYRDGSIWTCHAISVNNRAACRWYQINVAGSPSLQQNGTVSDASLYYFFPSIIVNSRGDAIMGFSGSKATQYASAYYTGRLVSDAAGEMANPAVLKAGLASQNNIDGYGRNRWGDYSLSTLDPDDGMTLWTIQEYAEAVNIWGTWIAKLSEYSDCNTNGVDDRTDITAGTSEDCDGNFLPDECEPQNDCQPNGVQDICDVAGGTSLDCNGNRTPDECEIDCNGNGTPDSCDIVAGTSHDCQPNGIPDECENDCNGNGFADECDIAAGTARDCQQNGIPDSCDIAAGTSHDCQLNGTPDECEIDCNSNGVGDACDVASGTSPDCNSNGVPDECDVEVCYGLWDGFQPNPPFSYGRPMGQIDYNNDGFFWTNPSGTAVISP
ncbi:MAG: hypothetical protein V2A79_19260, partial [Planctomycetota bacterium]